MATRTWQILKKGDIIDIVAPGSYAEPEVLKEAVSFLRKQGFRPRYSKGLQKKVNPFFANSNEYRFKDLKRALMARDSKAIWCLRGGYGAIKLVPELLKLKKVSKPKVLLGYSDVSTLHLFVNQKWNWSSIHSPLLDRLCGHKLTPVEKKWIFGLLGGELKEVQFTELKPLNQTARKKGKLSGSVIGGNLTVIQSSLATPLQIKGKGRILFFEEVSERGYRVDRMLEHLKQAGVFKGVKAVIFGSFIGGNESSGKNYVKQALQDFAASVSFPVLAGLKVGHGEHQRPLPFNTKALLVLGKKSALTVKSGAHE